jgi:dolichyldiphosphatase
VNLITVEISLQNTGVMEQAAKPLLKHTSLTCVHYQRNDTLGKLLAHVALAPVLVLVYQFAKVYTRRELHEAVLLAGLVLEEGFARGLKHLLQHPRPATCAMLHICHSHGMPSSHTSMMFCWTTLACCTALRHFSKQGTASRLLSVAELAAYGSIAVGVAASRVYLGYHSLDQVAAGAVFGILFGVVWSLLLHALQPVYKALAAVSWLQALGVKNTYSCAEPLLIEAAAFADQQQHSRSQAAKKQS